MSREHAWPSAFALAGKRGKGYLGAPALRLQREALWPAELLLEGASQGEKIELKQPAQNRRLRPLQKQAQKTPRGRVLNVPGGRKGTYVLWAYFAFRGALQGPLRKRP
jgi:hypothetical protein